MYIVVTGAAGFIGANLVKALNRRGENNILAVDDLDDNEKFTNLVDCEIADFLDKQSYLRQLEGGAFDGEIAAIVHQGACTDTTATDGHFIMQNNFEYSKRMLEYCTDEEVPFIYASSAAVYGAGPEFREARASESPLNIYGYSKFLFDQVVRYRSSDLAAQVVGLRYFNVYGDRERHKERMASVALHFFNQYRAHGKVRLFKGSGGYSNGEQRRDFVSVEDVIKVNLFFLDHPGKSGIFNVGTGAAQSFNDVAVTTVNVCRKHDTVAPLTLTQMQSQGIIEYINFPQDLEGKYQSFTQADIGALRAAGYSAPFLTVEEGVARYVEQLFERSTS
jgi:ADP-L-glycero-D-manno-heptose 6-epimerase